MGRKNVYGLMGFATMAMIMTSCQKASEETASVAAPKKLYVSSGLCHSGIGITTYGAAAPQPSRTVTRWNTSTGAQIDTLIDLNVGNNVSVNTFPQAIIDKGDHILLLTENATTGSDRKIWKIFKDDPSTFITYATDPTAFLAVAANITRAMVQDVDGSIHFSRSIAGERVNTLGVRLTKGGANPWLGSTAVTGNCFTAAATLISDLELMAPFTNTNQGKLIYTHSGATAATNRIGIVARTGLTAGTGADCITTNPAGGLSGTPHTLAPNLLGVSTFAATGPAPTSMVYIPTPAPATTTAKLIVSYSASAATQFDNSAAFVHGIVMWDVTETSDTAVTLGNPVILWNDHTVVWAASAMAYDASTESLYVAVGGSPGLMSQVAQTFGYNIEKFDLDINTPILTRVSENNQPFITGSAETKCISDMKIADE